MHPRYEEGGHDESGVQAAVGRVKVEREMVHV